MFCRFVVLFSVKLIFLFLLLLFLSFFLVSCFFFFLFFFFLFLCLFSSFFFRFFLFSLFIFFSFFYFLFFFPFFSFFHLQKSDSHINAVKGWRQTQKCLANVSNGIKWTKCGDIYIQIWVVRSWHQHFQLVIMLE